MNAHHLKPVVEEYDKIAPDYDRRWAFYIESTLRETLSRLDLQSGDRLLDIACGTGVLLESLSAAVPEAVLSGVDPSPRMLEVAGRRLGKAIELKRGDAANLPFPDRTFDIVTTTNAFHYFRDPVAALNEMARTLRPGGRLVITDWCDDYFTCWIYDRFLRIFNESHYRAYGTKQCRRLLTQAGYVNIEIERYKISRLWGLMTAQAQKNTSERQRPSRDGAQASRQQSYPQERTSALRTKSARTCDLRRWKVQEGRRDRGSVAR